ncbi:MAG: hypothetical protein ACLQA5_05715 [Solirubrobacteraceae bacterium]
MCANCKALDCDCNGGTAFAMCSCESGDLCLVCNHEPEASLNPEPDLAVAILSSDLDVGLE